VPVAPVVARPKASFHIPRKTWPSMVDPRCKLGISFLRLLLSDFSSIRMTCVSCCYSTFSTPDVVVGARLHLMQRVRGLPPGDKIFLLGREIKLVFSGFASLDHPGADSYDVPCSSHLPTWRQPRQELITV
jgi:hypothetical protein